LIFFTFIQSSTVFNLIHTLPLQKLYNSYQFKLDKWTDQGPSINAAFGSETEEDIRELHLILNAMLRRSPATSIAISHYAASRDSTASAGGDDSSGYFATDYNSILSNPNGIHAYGSAGEMILLIH
jgi:hypothetical protein